MAASVVVRDFLASLRADVGDLFESVRTCFQMLTVLPASRRAVLDHMASLFLNQRSDLQITRERDQQLMAIVAELSLKDWSHILGDWCCHVLSRSRFESPNTAFLEKLLVSCYKSGLESGTQLDWLHPTLLNVPFASRNIFSDLLRRFVANFSQSFVAGLVRYAMTVYRQQQQINVYAIGHTLDHLGHGFPGELQKIVDELLCTDQFSVQLLVDVAQTYPQVCAVFQSRLAWRLAGGADLRDMINFFNAPPPKISSLPPGISTNLLKRCLFNRSPTWPQLFRCIINAYCCPSSSLSTQTFSKLFLEELAVLIGSDSQQLFNGVSESDVVFLLDHTFNSSSNRALDAKLLATLSSAALLNTARPGEMMARILFGGDKSPFKPGSSIEFAAFYSILLSIAPRNGTVLPQFIDLAVEKIGESGGRERIWLVKQLIQTEKEQNLTEVTKVLSLVASFSRKFADLLLVLASPEQTGNPEIISLIVDLVPHFSDLVAKSPYTEKGGLAIVLQIATLIKSGNLMNAEKRVIVEKLLFLLYVYLNVWLPRQSSSISLLLLDAFVRTSFDCNSGNNDNKNNGLETSRLNQAFFTQTVKFLICPPPSQSLRNSSPLFDQGCIWRLQLGPPDPSSLMFLAKLLVQTISPDIIHVVATSSFEWPLDSAIENNQPIPVDYREYCLKIRTLVTITCPFLLDFLSFFVSTSSHSTNNMPIVILLPLFRALLYAALCSVTSSTKVGALSDINVQFITRVLLLLQQARLVAAPLCHLPAIIPQIEPSQLAITLRAAWPLLINVKTVQTPASTAQAIAPVLTIMKSKLADFAQILPLFEQNNNKSTE